MNAEALEQVRRNSGIHLTRDGRFVFKGRDVEHPRVSRLFHKGLSVRSDGDVTLTVGRTWAYVTCDGVARFVDGLDMSADLPSFRMRHGENFQGVPSFVGYGPDDRFYVWLDDSSWPALVSRSAHQTLAGCMVDGPAVEWSLGCQSRVVVLVDAPSASSSWPKGGLCR